MDAAFELNLIVVNISGRGRSAQEAWYGILNIRLLKSMYKNYKDGAKAKSGVNEEINCSSITSAYSGLLSGTPYVIFLGPGAYDYDP